MPASGEVYFSAAPEKQMVPRKVGESVTLTVTAFSDGPMPEDWEIEATDFGRVTGAPASLDAKRDRTPMHDGENPGSP